MTELLSDIFGSVQTIATWVSVLAGGVVLTYYVLPHISGKIHANAITFAWVTALLSLWSFVIQPEWIDPLVSIFRYFLSLTIYQLASYSGLQAILDTILSAIAAWTIKIAFFPDHHHSKIA